MLLRHESRWWPAAALLLAQGLWVRWRTEKLPAAASPRGSVGQGERQLRLVGLGDSIIAGVGVTDQREGLLGQVAALIAARAPARVNWVAVAESGCTAHEARERLLAAARAECPDLVLLSAGVNDAVAGREAVVFKADLAAIIDGLADSRSAPAVVFAGLPPLDQFPALPWPLARLLGDRAAGLQQAAVSLAGYRGLKVVTFPRRLAAAGFARDGFHPGPRACAEWARWVADGFALALE